MWAQTTSNILTVTCLCRLCGYQIMVKQEQHMKKLQLLTMKERAKEIWIHSDNNNNNNKKGRGSSPTAATGNASLHSDDSTSSSSSFSSTTALSEGGGEGDDLALLGAINSLHCAILYPPNSLLVTHSATFLAQGFS